MIRMAAGGIFGMNRRNRGLILAENTPRALELANDKEGTKRALARERVPVPRTLGLLRHQRDVPALYRELVRLGGPFVVKPVRGSRGRGVELFNRALPDRVLAMHDRPWTPHEFGYYLCRIVAGEFSATHRVEEALVEERIDPDKDWIVPGLPGAPDLRIIVHRGRPSLAMTRLPTIASEGKANLHRGGVGVGIDIRTGITTHAIFKERPVSHHPDTGESLSGRRVDGFEECLDMAARCFAGVPLGYMGVDIIRDRARGPIVIEVNGRPGLAIQLANRIGLGQVVGRETTS